MKEKKKKIVDPTSEQFVGPTLNSISLVGPTCEQPCVQV